MGLWNDWPLHGGHREPTRPKFVELRSSRWFIMFTVSFATCTDIFMYGLIVPVTPTALERKVGFSGDQIQSWTSILLALYSAALLAFSPIIGYVADRTESRRWPLLLGLVALAAATALLCVGTHIGLWIAGRLFQGAAAAVVWTVGVALMVDTVGKEGLGQAIGYVSMSISVGTLAGPLLGGVLYEDGGYYSVFGLAFGLIAIDIILRLALIEKRHALPWIQPVNKPSAHSEPDDLEKTNTPTVAGPVDSPGASISPTPEALKQANIPKSPLKQVKTLLSSYRLVVSFWGYFVMSLIMTSFDSVLPLFVQDTFGWQQTGQGLAFIPLMVPHLVDPITGYIIDRFPKSPRYIVTAGFLSAVPLAVLLRLVTENTMHHKILLCALLALLGVCLAIVMTPLVAEVFHAVKEKENESPEIFGRGGRNGSGVWPFQHGLRGRQSDRICSTDHPLRATSILIPMSLPHPGIHLPRASIPMHTPQAQVGSPQRPHADPTGLDWNFDGVSSGRCSGVEEGRISRPLLWKLTFSLLLAMTGPEVHHPMLNATFKGIKRDDQDTGVYQFLGIKYARVPARFERAEPVEGFGGAIVDSTRYGPRCPQADVDVRHLLRIPEDFAIRPEKEDEFECLNLEITCPPVLSTTEPLPVLVWIHGGSQIVTFCSAASKICDPTKLVADSIKTGNPIIFVSINYRLNIFSFGDGKEKNLALKDQRLGIDWVRKNIAAFGGDSSNITLSGESAGAIYTHAHLITGPPVKRAILASGTLYLSSPLPMERGDALIKALESKVQELGQPSLRGSSTSALVQALKECNVNTMWIQEEPELMGWETKPEQADELMIGDTEYESVIWRNGVEQLDGETIAAAFENDKNWATQLRKMYHIVGDRPTAAKLGALDLVHDARYTLPVEVISRKFEAAKKRVYKYVVDQPNPWQASSRAHHAVDLLFLFDGVDLSFNPAATAVGQIMRQRWIRFVSGQAPWSTESRFAFGPVGECKEINEAQFAIRRRVNHCKVLQEAGAGVYMPILAALTAGRINLLN
ncbi:hypothetical protein N7532_004944 [Penicillium argentinense]|uniref:Major facilitator superfamily (MFS) profile domain-containing protein n=1 Tax=Penicillium argentinense TaxID=1131581 RepID=A0A9W9FD12_9EURO|nr:uncharacterized protein N7532_004944 [Penicillium argentinense]KAJ5097943.1 hypothetical protein N7532_004944 [Penicillium argentinense]